MRSGGPQVGDLLGFLTSCQRSDRKTHPNKKKAFSSSPGPHKLLGSDSLHYFPFSKELVQSFLSLAPFL